MLDDTLDSDVLVVPHAPQQQLEIPQTPVNVRRSTRLSRPPEIFSPNLYSISLIDVGEPEGYDEAM